MLHHLSLRSQQISVCLHWISSFSIVINISAEFCLQFHLCWPRCKSRQRIFLFSSSRSVPFPSFTVHSLCIVHFLVLAINKFAFILCYPIWPCQDAFNENIFQFGLQGFRFQWLSAQCYQEIWFWFGHWMKLTKFAFMGNLCSIHDNNFGYQNGKSM